MATGSQSPTMIGFEVLMLVPETVSVLLARGALAVVFGLVALIWPIGTAAALAALFGAYAFVDGVGLTVAALSGHSRSSRRANAPSGLAGLIMAMQAVTWPGITVLALAVLAGVWALLTGVGEIVAAVRLRRRINGGFYLAAAGLAFVIAGVLVLLRPLAGVIGIAVVLGAGALVYGAALIAMALPLRSRARRMSGSHDRSR